MAPNTPSGRHAAWRRRARSHATRLVDSDGFVLCACNAVKIEFHGWQSRNRYGGHGVDDCDPVLPDLIDNAQRSTPCEGCGSPFCELALKVISLAKNETAPEHQTPQALQTTLPLPNNGTPIK